MSSGLGTQASGIRGTSGVFQNWEADLLSPVTMPRLLSLLPFWSAKLRFWPLLWRASDPLLSVSAYGACSQPGEQAFSPSLRPRSTQGSAAEGGPSAEMRDSPVLWGCSPAPLSPAICRMSHPGDFWNCLLRVAQTKLAPLPCWPGRD